MFHWYDENHPYFSSGGTRRRKEQSDQCLKRTVNNSSDFLFVYLFFMKDTTAMEDKNVPTVAPAQQQDFMVGELAEAPLGRKNPDDQWDME